jgi:hypothetical protein
MMATQKMLCHQSQPLNCLGPPQPRLAGRTKSESAASLRSRLAHSNQISNAEWFIKLRGRPEDQIEVQEFLLEDESKL